MSSDQDQLDPYKTLGVSKAATDAEIKKAYRGLAKKLHPDVHQGDAALEDQFKSVSAAYDFLRDPERRRRFDAGEIDATGAEMPERDFYRQYAGAGQRHQYEPAGSEEDLNEFFSQAFGHGGRTGTRGHSGPIRMRGADLRYHLEISFLDAINGATRRVTMPDGKTLDITIPPGVREGQTLRLAGHGQPGINDGPPGNALISISVLPDKIFQRDGQDVLLDLPISIDEAVLGGSVDVPTPSGRVKLRIPEGSSSGRVMRLKGKGAKPQKGAAGDLLVTLKIVLPDPQDTALKEAVSTWRDTNTYDARKSWKGGAS
jgi:DnaJ-class molecular chaperone